MSRIDAQVDGAVTATPKDPPTPRVTIVTPSYNQAAYLDKTLRSVLDQGYPNLEYFVVDGGSTDGSVEIIRRYESQLAWWTSERDRGQSHAINKGLSRATGEILGWINSDDFLADGALARVASALSDPASAPIVAGHCVLIDETGKQTFCRGEFRSYRHLSSRYAAYSLHQPSIFWRKAVTDAIGLLDESQHLIMDFDYWYRMSDRFGFQNIDAVLSYCHRHAAAKTADEHVGYHAARRRYLAERRHALPAADRRWLMLHEPLHAVAAAVASLAKRMGARQ